jgi:hypothetical protein
VDTFSYVSGFTTVILALGVARLLVGTGKLLERRGQMRLYWVHLMWVVNVFLFLALQWWILFRWQSETEWTFFLFLFLLASPTVVFLLCVMLFHDPFTEHTDFKQHFYQSRRAFFALASALGPLDFVDTYLKGYSHLIAQGPFYILTIALTTALSAIAALTDNEKYHKFYAVFFLIYILIFISVNLSLLQ